MASSKFTYEWKIPVCNCYGDNNCPHSTTFEFDNIVNDEQFSGTLKIISESQGRRGICQFDLSSKTHCIWKVDVKLFLSDKSKPKTSDVLSEENCSTSITLYDAYICLLSDQTKVICEVHFFNYKKNPITPSMRTFTLSSNLLELMKSKKHWDVTLVVDGREIHAHKAILASRSKVFAAMFEHEMDEAKSNQVTISDIDFEVFEQVLLYMYTDAVEDLYKIARQLLAASEKYDLPELKFKCQYALIANLDITNAADILYIADLYSAEKLKKKAINFISINSKEVIKTDGFKLLEETRNCHLLLELYKSIVKQF